LTIKRKIAESQTKQAMPSHNMKASM
jgi:hypothetical protein